MLFCMFVLLQGESAYVFLPQYRGLGIQLHWSGPIEDGKAEGKGKLKILYEGDVVGTFKGVITNGQLQKGTLEVPHKQRYKGTFHRGLPDGEGKMEWANSSGKFGLAAVVVYEGGWQKGTFHGHGVLSEPPKKLRFEGHFVNGVRHGFGTEFAWALKPGRSEKMTSDAFRGVAIDRMKNTTSHEYRPLRDGYWVGGVYYGEKEPVGLAEQ